MNERKIRSEIETWKYLASSLTQEHQQSVKSEILTKVKYLESQLKEKSEEIYYEDSKPHYDQDAVAEHLFKFRNTSLH